MIETTDYWISNETFIFKSCFNSSINIYNDILSNYNKLIFSNCDDLNIYFKTNNNYGEIYRKLISTTKYNFWIKI